MDPPRPTDTTRAARAVLDETALPQVEGHFGVPASTVREIAQLGAEQGLDALAAPPSPHGGWSTLLAGASLARNSEQLSPQADGSDPEPSFTVGLAWAGLVTGAVGGELLDAAERAELAEPHPPAPPPPWRPGGEAQAVRAAARELADSRLAPGSSPRSRRRFAEQAIDQLDAGIVDLDHELAGWSLCATGAWAAAREADITAPLTARRGLLRREPKLPMAAAGCGYAGALLAQIGLILLELA